MSVAAGLLGGKDAMKKTSLAYNLSGLGAAEASEDAAKLQAAAGRESIALQRETRDLARADLQPFKQFGQGNISALQGLLTPQGQYDYLQANPLFQAALDNANRSTMNIQAARGKLGSGDTLSALTRNTLLTAQPMIDRQQNALFNAVNLGQASAAGQANTALTSGAGISDTIENIGNARAAGLVGGANARQAGASSFTNAFGQIFGGMMASDRRLKRNITPAGKHGAYNAYFYQYKDSDDWYFGAMADEVAKIKPEAVSVREDGYLQVDYGAL